jgi:hypothetical protein
VDAQHQICVQSTEQLHRVGPSSGAARSRPLIAAPIGSDNLSQRKAIAELPRAIMRDHGNEGLRRPRAHGNLVAAFAVVLGGRAYLRGLDTCALWAFTGPTDKRAWRWHSEAEMRPAGQKTSAAVRCPWRWPRAAPGGLAGRPSEALVEVW